MISDPILQALGLAPTDHAPAFQFSGCFGYHGPLRLGPVIGMKIEHDPVARSIQLVGPGGVREQGGQVPVAALGVQYR